MFCNITCIRCTYSFLETNIPGFDYRTDFGGVFYTFLRGVDQTINKSTGIFFDLPNQAIIEKIYGLMKLEN